MDGKRRFPSNLPFYQSVARALHITHSLATILYSKHVCFPNSTLIDDYGAEGVSRTRITCFSDRRRDHLGYLSKTDHTTLQ